ncbi:hypothetical protein FRB90_004865 [Tulasnella sp. 427]|nr:hypothetical protein FRB90_004865 [Tulasnella sp. 427]
MPSSQPSNTSNATNNQLPRYYIPGAPVSNSFIRKWLRIWFRVITFPWTIPIQIILSILELASLPKTPDEESYGWEDIVALERALQPFDTPTLLPPSSRIDPWRPSKPPHNFWSIFTVIKLCIFLNIKAYQVSKAIIRHLIYGPKLPSWSIEMTIVTTFMQNLSQHSGLTNWWLIRTMMYLLDRVPVPSSFVVRPVEFRVHKHNLPGILKDLDEQEDGSRVLGGEWIVDRRIWESRRMGYIASKHKGAGDRVMLYLHGGAYCIFSAETHRLITANMFRSCGLRVFALNYRLAPETRFPGALQDSVLAYLHLIKELQVPPSHIIIAGDSAGGGLAVSTLLYLRDSNLPLPGGAILLSPWVDLTLSTLSWETNAQFDVCPLPEPGDHLDPVQCYLGSDGLRNGLATNPYVSPLFAKYDVNESEGRNRLLPPLLIQCGGAEVLRDEGMLLAHKAAKGGVHVVFEYYQDAVHVFQTFTWLQPAGKAFDRCGLFVKHTIPAHQAASSASANNSSSLVGGGYGSGVPTTIEEENEVAEEAIRTRVDQEIGGGDPSEIIVVDEMGEAEEGGLVEKVGGEGEDGERNDIRELGEEGGQHGKRELQSEQADEPARTNSVNATQENSPTDSSRSIPTLNVTTFNTIPRSRSTTSLSSPSQRRHSRRWTGLHGFSPLSRDESGGGDNWTFTSNPTSPGFAWSPSSDGGNGYFVLSAAAGAAGAGGPSASLATPGVRQERTRRSRSSTVSSENEVAIAGEEVGNLVRQWEEEGPANESVLCRKV